MDWYVRHFLSIWKASMINSFEKLYLEAQSTLNHKFSTLLWKYHHDHVPCLHLTILTGNKLCILGFTQFSARMAAWLILTFFIYLDNQLSSIHSIMTYQRIQMFEKYDSSNRQ